MSKAFCKELYLVSYRVPFLSNEQRYKFCRLCGPSVTFCTALKSEVQHLVLPCQVQPIFVDSHNKAFYSVDLYSPQFTAPISLEQYFFLLHRYIAP